MLSVHEGTGPPMIILGLLAMVHFGGVAFTGAKRENVQDGSYEMTEITKSWNGQTGFCKNGLLFLSSYHHVSSFICLVVPLIHKSNFTKINII